VAGHGTTAVMTANRRFWARLWPARECAPVDCGVPSGCAGTV